MAEGYIYALSINETYMAFTARAIKKIEQLIKENKLMQNAIQEKLLQSSSHCTNYKTSKITNSTCYMKPYFKTNCSISSPLSSEACAILAVTDVDCLLRPEKPWRLSDIKNLRSGVKSSVIENFLIPQKGRAELLAEKISNSGVDTSEECKENLRKHLCQMHTQINYQLSHGSEKIFLEQCQQGNDELVDWRKISTVLFNGERTAMQLRAKWLNELSPKWNSDPWSKDEDKLLEELVELTTVGSKNWNKIANLLAIGQAKPRSPFQCFQRWVDLRHIRRTKKYWTAQEDKILLTCVKSYKSLDVVNWAQVSRSLPGRSKFMCELRYRRTLCDSLRKGSWTAEEDENLLLAVRKYGTADWHLISKFVPGRTNLQCRNRYQNNLRESLKEGMFTLEEDERLLFGVKVFGRHQLAVVAKFLPDRGMDCIKARFRSFIKARIAASRARLVDKYTKKIEYQVPNPIYDFTAFLDAQELQSALNVIENNKYQPIAALSVKMNSVKCEPLDAECEEENVLYDNDKIIAEEIAPRNDGRWCMTLKGGWVNLGRQPVDPMKNIGETKRKEMCDFLNSIYEHYGSKEKDAKDKDRYKRLSALLNSAFFILPGDFHFVGKRVKRVLDGKDDRELIPQWPYQIRNRRIKPHNQSMVEKVIQETKRGRKPGRKSKNHEDSDTNANSDSDSDTLTEPSTIGKKYRNGTGRATLEQSNDRNHNNNKIAIKEERNLNHNFIEKKKCGRKCLNFTHGIANNYVLSEATNEMSDGNIVNEKREGVENCQKENIIEKKKRGRKRIICLESARDAQPNVKKSLLNSSPDNMKEKLINALPFANRREMPARRASATAKLRIRSSYKKE